MIVEINKLFDNCYKKKHKLLKINCKSTKYRDYKKSYNAKKLKLVLQYADNINKKFIENCLDDNQNKLLVSCIDNNDIDYYNISGIIICRKTFNSKDKIRYIILLIAVKPNVRGYGYGGIILEDMKEYFFKNNKVLEIILHSLKASYNFYVKNGFKQIEKNSFLERYESVDYNNFILMKLTIN